MKYSCSMLLLSLYVSVSACQGNKQKFEPMVDIIKTAVLNEVNNIKRVDTVYLLIKIMTPRDKQVIQAVEYTWASTEAKRAQSPDSAFMNGMPTCFSLKLIEWTAPHSYITWQTQMLYLPIRT